MFVQVVATNSRNDPTCTSVIIAPCRYVSLIVLLIYLFLMNVPLHSSWTKEEPFISITFNLLMIYFIVLTINPSVLIRSKATFQTNQLTPVCSSDFCFTELIEQILWDASRKTKKCLCLFHFPRSFICTASPKRHILLKCIK